LEIINGLLSKKYLEGGEILPVNVKFVSFPRFTSVHWKGGGSLSPLSPLGG